MQAILKLFAALSLTFCIFLISPTQLLAQIEDNQLTSELNLSDVEECQTSDSACASDFVCTCSGLDDSGAAIVKAVDGPTNLFSCNTSCQTLGSQTTSSFQCTNKCGFKKNFSSQPPASAITGEQQKEPIIPQFNVQIPGLTEEDLRKGITKDPVTGDLQVNFLGLYVAAAYKVLLGLASLIAVVMVVVAGFQWLASRGDAGRIGRAKERIQNVVIGLLLLFGCAVIASFLDPRLVNFESLSVRYVAKLELPPEGEDLDINARDNLTTDRDEIFGENIINQAKDPTLAPEAAQALIQAGDYLFNKYGERIRIESANRDLHKQAALFYQNCLATGGNCKPPTCNVAGSDLVQKINGRFVATGELALMTSADAIINKMASNGQVGACPHTSGIAVDAWCQSGGDYQVDPDCQQRVIEAMLANGFCRLSAEPWHFELNSSKVSNKCLMSNNTTAFTTYSGTYTPPSGCAKYDFKNHRCIAYR